MKINYFKSSLVSLLMLSLLIIPAKSLLANENEDVFEAVPLEVGLSSIEASNVTKEAKSLLHETGMLIEIGNTTAEETTLIIRVTKNEISEDKTLQINSETTLINNKEADSDLSTWIAGDQIKYTAEIGDNSGELVALVIKNKSFQNYHFGKNGWVKAIRPELNEMDIEWAGNIYTLNTTNSKMVAGLKNPATLEDFKIDDRIRARVIRDNDNNANTWDAQIIVVLRRGKTLFMRVTRWVVPAEITELPTNMSEYPFEIKAKVLESKFYEDGDVNNLIGAPGTEITITIDESTKLVRRYLGKSILNEFMAGDQIRIIGRLNEESGNLDAKIIKNNSIQALGVSNRVSIVKEINVEDNTIKVVPIGVKDPQTGKRRRITDGTEWTLELDENTKTMKDGIKITINDIAIDDIIRVRGVAHRLQTTITTKAINVLPIKNEISNE